MSSDSKIMLPRNLLLTIIYVYIYIYNLALNKPHSLICHKNNQTKSILPRMFVCMYLCTCECLTMSLLYSLAASDILGI